MPEILEGTLGDRELPQPTRVKRSWMDSETMRTALTRVQMRIAKGLKPSEQVMIGLTPGEVKEYGKSAPRVLFLRMKSIVQEWGEKTYSVSSFKSGEKYFVAVTAPAVNELPASVRETTGESQGNGGGTAVAPAREQQQASQAKSQTSQTSPKRSRRVA